MNLGPGGDAVQVILVRHADAAAVGEQGATNDSDRPLTDLGHEQAKALAEAFRRCGVVPAAVVSSPLTRALQTAEPLLGLLAGSVASPEICGVLSPEEYGPKKLSKYVNELNAGPVVLVGHNPSISEFARWLLNGVEGGVEMEKASAARIDCRAGPGKGEGVLRWLVSPEWYMGERPA